MSDFPLNIAGTKAREAVLAEHPTAECVKNHSNTGYIVRIPAVIPGAVSRVLATGFTASDAWFKATGSVLPRADASTIVETNKVLHDYYVWCAMDHLTVLRKCVKKLYNSNFNWHGPRTALLKARAELLHENATYQEAAWRLLAGEVVVYDDGSPIGTYNPAEEARSDAYERIIAERDERRNAGKAGT